MICEAGLALSLFFHKDQDRWKLCIADIHQLKALAGWKRGGFLIWKTKDLDCIIFPLGLTFCVSLILEQNGVSLISSLLPPFWNHFLSHCRSRHEFPSSGCIEVPNLCCSSAHKTHSGFQIWDQLLFPVRRDCLCKLLVEGVWVLKWLIGYWW